MSQEQMREYVRIWEGNRPLLEAIRDHEIREADTAHSIRMLEQAFRIALRDLPRRPSSGLVECQKAMVCAASRRRRGG